MNYRVTYTNGEPIIEHRVKKKFLGLTYEGWEPTYSMKLQDAAQAFKDNLNPQKFDTKRRTEPKFTFQGVTYYHFPNEEDMSPMRYATALTYQKESSMNCDREYLKGFVQGIYDNINTKTGVINLVNIVSLLRNLNERLESAYLPDLIYKEASVLYFDETENPEDYDWEYNRKKIEKWKAAGEDFFLQTLAKDLVVSDVLSDKNSAIYMKTADLLDIETTKEVLSSLSQNMSKEQLKNYSELRIKAGLV